MSESTPPVAFIRADLSSETTEIALPAVGQRDFEIDTIVLRIATGSTQHERIWNPTYIDTSEWDLTVTENVLVLDLPDDLPDNAQCTVTVGYK